MKQLLLKFYLWYFLRWAALPSSALPLPSPSDGLCRSPQWVFHWSAVWGAVPRPGAVCGWCRGLPAGGTSGLWVPGPTGCPADQTPLAPGLQVPAWFPQGGAMSANLLEGPSAARSVGHEYVALMRILTILGWLCFCLLLFSHEPLKRFQWIPDWKMIDSPILTH